MICNKQKKTSKNAYKIQRWIDKYVQFCVLPIVPPCIPIRMQQKKKKKTVPHIHIQTPASNIENYRMKHLLKFVIEMKCVVGELPFPKDTLGEDGPGTNGWSICRIHCDTQYTEHKTHTHKAHTHTHANTICWITMRCCKLDVHACV